MADALSKLDALITQGSYSQVIKIGGLDVVFKTLNYGEETEVLKVIGDQGTDAGNIRSLTLYRLEQLTLSIQSIDGDPITDRDKLRETLKKLPAKHFQEFYKGFEKVLSELPELSAENMKLPLSKAQSADPSLKSASTQEHSPVTLQFDN